MHKKLIARTAKLHSEPKKGRRFKGIAITYEHISTDVEERNHGSIYAVININCENPEAEDIANLIIDAFHGEFYDNLNKPAEVAFEKALAKINEELADATHQGNINWLNNLNAILAVLSNNVLHVTQAGKSDVFLYRGEKSSKISDDLSGDSINPIRTFINIASGELVEGDKVAIVTPSVFYHISKDELKRYVNEFQPKVAISHIADLLEGTSNQMNPNAVLIIEAITPEAASNETLEEQPDEIWISEPAKPVETAIDTATPILKKIGAGLAVGYGAARAFTSEKVVPLVKSGSEKLAETTQKSIKNIQESRKPKTKADVIFDTDEDILTERMSSDDDLSITAEVDGSIITEPTIKTKSNEIFIKAENVKSKNKLNFSTIKKAGANAISLSQKYTKKYSKKNLAIIAGVVILVLFVGVFALWRQRESAESLKLANFSYVEAESKYEVGKNFISNGNRGQGAVNLQDAKKIAESLKDNKKLKEKVATLLSNINTALDQAENTIRPSVNEFANATEIVGNNVLGPYVVDDNMYIINAENGSIAAVSLKNKEVSNVLDKPSIEGKITAATPVLARNVIVIATDKGNLYEFDTVENTVKKQAISGTLGSVVAMSSFSTNIYLLSPEGKIYKRLRTSTGYGIATEYITDKNYASNAKAMAIDSSIYVLSGNGNVTKYLAGKKENFSISDLPITVSNANYIFTDENTEGFYIVNTDTNKIIRFDANGKFVSQFASDSFNGIVGVYADNESKQLYIVSSGKVFNLSY